MVLNALFWKINARKNSPSDKVKIIRGSKGEQKILGYHRIFTGDSRPITASLYKLGVKKEEAAAEIIKKYQAEGIIRPSNSAWRSQL